MTRYIDRHGRVLFVHDGISDGRAWGVFYRKPSGSLCRVKSEHLPVCGTQEAAQQCLDGWAKARKLRVVP
ncbi:MAG: hypothetical protein C4551_06615 [Bacillota bacterium]|jgi:hypothetical protein|nr:MAG: hypothetical protein C4551_06615 [Bacillota bacterium]